MTKTLSVKSRLLMVVAALAVSLVGSVSLLSDDAEARNRIAGPGTGCFQGPSGGVICVAWPKR